MKKHVFLAALAASFCGFADGGPWSAPLYRVTGQVGGIDSNAVKEIIRSYEKVRNPIDDEDCAHADVFRWYLCQSGLETNPAKLDWRNEDQKWSGSAFLSSKKIPVEMTCCWTNGHWTFTGVGHLPPELGGTDVPLGTFTGFDNRFDLPNPIGQLHVWAASGYTLDSWADVEERLAGYEGGCDPNAVSNIVNAMELREKNDNNVYKKAYGLWHITSDDANRPMDFLHVCERDIDSYQPQYVKTSFYVGKWTFQFTSTFDLRDYTGETAPEAFAEDLTEIDVTMVNTEDSSDTFTFHATRDLILNGFSWYNDEFVGKCFVATKLRSKNDLGVYLTDYSMGAWAFSHDIIDSEGWCDDPTKKAQLVAAVNARLPDLHFIPYPDDPESGDYTFGGGVIFTFSGVDFYSVEDHLEGEYKYAEELFLTFYDNQDRDLSTKSVHMFIGREMLEPGLRDPNDVLVRKSDIVPYVKSLITTGQLKLKTDGSGKVVVDE